MVFEVTDNLNGDVIETKKTDNIEKNSRRGPKQRRLLLTQVENQSEFHATSKDFYEKCLKIKKEKLDELKKIRRANEKTLKIKEKELLIKEKTFKLLEDDVKNKTQYRTQN